MRNCIVKMLLSTCLCALCIIGNAQTVIQMEEYGGVYRIPCKVNGAKMKLIFDTGADKVCISLTMAEYLLDNDFISQNDIKGNGTTTVADGRVVNHVKINIKDIEIQGIHLKNVEAIVVDGQNAPLLLGQSAIKKLGKYSIQGNKLIIGSDNSYSSQQTKTRQLTITEILDLYNKAADAYNNRLYYVALELFKQLLEQDSLIDAVGLNVWAELDLYYADCYYYTEQIEDALRLYQSIIRSIEGLSPDNKSALYFQIGRCFNRIGNNDAAMQYLEKAKYYADAFSPFQVQIVVYIAIVYKDKGDYYRAGKVLDDYVQQYLQNKGLRPTDCWTKSLRDETIADMYYERFCMSENDNDVFEKYIIIAAAWGSKEAIEFCRKYNFQYQTKPSKYIY